MRLSATEGSERGDDDASYQNDDYDRQQPEAAPCGRSHRRERCVCFRGLTHVSLNRLQCSYNGTTDEHHDDGRDDCGDETDENADIYELSHYAFGQLPQIFTSLRFEL